MGKSFSKNSEEISETEINNAEKSADNLREFNATLLKIFKKFNFDITKDPEAIKLVQDLFVSNIENITSKDIENVKKKISDDKLSEDEGNQIIKDIENSKNEKLKIFREEFTKKIFLNYILT